MRVRRKLFLTTAFAALLGVGVFAGVASQKEVTKVEAGASHTIYYATTTSRSDYYARCKYGDNWFGSHTFSLAGKSGSKYIYTASVFEEYGGLNNLWIKYGNDPTGDTGGTLVVEAINTWTVVSDYENKVYDGSWKNIYTVTYNTNGGKGSNKTDYKIHGTSYSILTYANAGISAAGGRHAVKWNTQSNGSGTNYQPGASYTSNENLTLHFIQDWYTYQFSNNGGSTWNTMTKKSATPEGYVAEFESSTHSFASGDTVSFRRYYGTESPSVVTPSSYENNISNSGVIYYSYDGKIYIKVTNDDGHTVYAEGFSARGIVVVRGGHEYKCSCSEDSNIQWHVDNITLLPGDTLKATYNGGTSYTIYVENTDVYGITSAGVVSTPGVYTIYLKSNDGGYNFSNVYLNMDDTATGTLIAQTFNTALEAVCNSTVSGGSTAQITSAYSTQSNYYNHLPSTCKTLVATGSTSDTDILAMRAKYDYIIRKYGTNIAPNYMGLNNGYQATPLNGALFLLTNNGESVVSVSVVVAIATASLAAIGGYFLFRKKKEN